MYKGAGRLGVRLTDVNTKHPPQKIQEEAVEVTGHADPLAAARAVLARPNAKTRWAVVKEGGAGALLVERGGAAHSCPAMAVDVVDTVGCGDSFAAAVVAGFIRGHDARGTLALANAVGAATATGRGAGTNVADVATVERLLREAARGGVHDAAAVASAAQLLQATLGGGGGDGGGGGEGSGGRQQRSGGREAARAA
jgi:bifunctional ADP-heptose synthase (sugar kinase/adenylyltransferase)